MVSSCTPVYYLGGAFTDLYASCKTHASSHPDFVELGTIPIYTEKKL